MASVTDLTDEVLHRFIIIVIKKKKKKGKEGKNKYTANSQFKSDAGRVGEDILVSAVG